jgi:hypothetical protein
MIKLVNGVPVQMTQEEQDAWLESLPAPDPVPRQVSALQGLLAIDAAGLSEAYSDWASSESRTFAERAFIDKALHWNRTDPVLLSGATALGLTSDQVDQLFISASAL